MKRLIISLQLAACFMIFPTGMSTAFAADDMSGVQEIQAQTHAVRGVINDANGPVAGVNVIVKGTTNGAISNGTGAYVLQNVPVGSVLQFTFIGYKTQEVTVGAQEVINVFMEEDTNLLEELVVIGYGAVKKSDLTGSVASVTEEQMTRAATSDPLQAIQGRAAGVQIISATGSPSATAEIKIRGTGSPNGTTPLFVVDGFPMNDIDHLSPNDIASLEILKDASACAIYGSRGANGVVLITTKKASAGKIKVKVTAEYGIENLPTRPEMLSAQQYAEMTNKALANSGKDPRYANPASLQSTDWFDEVMRVGRYQNYSASMSGGSDKISTMFSTNYFRRDGTVQKTNFDRLNFTQNTTWNVAKWLKLTSSFQGSFSRSNTLGANGTNNNTIFLSSLIAPPDVPVWNDQTNYYSGIEAFRLANPAGVIERNNSSSTRTNLVANFNADVKILPSLTFTSRFGYRWNVGLGSNYDPKYYETQSISSPRDGISRSTNKSTDWTWENMLTFHKQWGAHDLTVLGAVSAREFATENWSASKNSLPNPSPIYHYFNAASENPQASGNASELSMLSYLGRINYNVLDRYLLTVSMRADGSSRFLKQNRWGYFPSGAFAWKLSEEPFFQNWDQNAINNVKVRLGWGQIGNERISSYYPYLTGISQQQYYTIGTGQVRTNGARPSGIGNADVMWETSEQLNVGLDLSFLTDRLSFTFDWFNRKTDNILLSQSIPRTSGFGSMTRNVGGMSNKGVELTIGWKDDVGDFSYSIDANVSFIKNEVTNLGTSTNLSGSFAYDYALIDFQGKFPGVIRSEVGMPYNCFYGYIFDGIFQDQAQIDNYKSKDGTVIMPGAKPGDSIFRDLNENGKIDTGDQTFIGNPHPKAIYGLSFNAEYKGFDLNLLFQGVAGNDVFNASKFYFEKFDGSQNAYASSYMKGWDGKGSTNTVPIMLDGVSEKSRIDNNWRQSTMYIEDGSYIRLKNIQLGYTFKPSIQSFKPSIRVYIAAQNLLTITKYSGVDPEIPDNGVDRGQYPQPRTLMIGANINF